MSYTYLITVANLNGTENNTQSKVALVLKLGFTPTQIVTEYFTFLLKYTKSVKDMGDEIAISIGKIVNKKIGSIGKQQVFPLTLIILISSFIPIIVYITLKGTSSMFR